ncbi:MAG TPA: NADH-quinone oxidoreductase subunit J [Planctomycetota bacterium]|nr:NADH-quinone oxidoreductase subunit J [Planctomycetota bacterium]
MLDFVFVAAATVCILSGLLIVSQKNPVYSVVYMLPFFLGMTTLFVLLSATFLAAIQMIVYGGAILVVFLFVIMLINLKPEELRDDMHLGPSLLSAIGAGLLCGIIAKFVRNGVPAEIATRTATGTDGTRQIVPDNLFTAFSAPLNDTMFGSIGDIATPLFKNHVVPFELASVLIVVAMLGAVLLSKKRV